MLSKPEHGWSCFSLCEKDFYLSYLTNVAQDWLDQAIRGLETLQPFTVHGFCEPGRLICNVSYWNCHIIFEDEDRFELLKEDTEWYIAHISMLEFCQKLYEDISVNIDAWAEWEPLLHMNDKERQRTARETKIRLESRLCRLKELILKTQAAF